MIGSWTSSGDRQQQGLGQQGYQAGIDDSELMEDFFLSLRAMVRTLRGKRIAMLGLSADRQTAGSIDSTALSMAQRILDAGSTVVAYDARLGAHAAMVLSHPRFACTDDPYEAMNGADAIVVMTDCTVSRNLDLVAAKHRVRRPILADAGPFLSAAAVRAAGFQYTAPGATCCREVISLPATLPPGVHSALAS